MAVITSFERGDAKNLSRHRTEVSAKIFVFGSEPAGPMFQISTSGSKDRAIPNKVSQTIQLDRQAALTLWGLLGKEYGFK